MWVIRVMRVMRVMRVRVISHKENFATFVQQFSFFCMKFCLPRRAVMPGVNVVMLCAFEKERDSKPLGACPTGPRAASLNNE